MIEHVHNVGKGGKREAPSTSESAPKQGRPKIVHSLSQRYPSITEESDICRDEDSQALSVELAKERPKKDSVLPLMKRTFYARRQSILSDTSVPVATFLERFKAFTLTYVVSFACMCLINLQVYLQILYLICSWSKRSILS